MSSEEVVGNRTALTRGMTRSVVAASLALTLLAAGLFLAVHHPLAPAVAVAGCVAAVVICLRFDHAWLVLLPALLPVVDLAPWTGWLTFEEFDILVLGSAAGAWFRHGWAPGVSAPARVSKLLLILVALYLLLLAISLARGVEDAGGFTFGWFQGYDGPMNSVRLAKSFMLATLFVPLLGRVNSRLDSRGVAYLGWGMSLGLATVSVAAIWERMAFPGLLNFSADYRTTAMFWEMHVGGAALDGFLALTLPFAAMLMLRSRRIGHLLPAGFILVLGIYASLTTFSRGVYLAMAASLATMTVLLISRSATLGSGTVGKKKVVIGLASMAIFAGIAALVFRHGGYRATLALIGCLCLFVLTIEHARSFSGRLWTAALVLAILLVAMAFGVTRLDGKGSYGSYATIFLLSMFALGLSFRSNTESVRVLAQSGALALPFPAALVADHWGGTPALIDMTIALVLLTGFAYWGIRTKHRVWPTGWRDQGIAIAGALGIAATVAIFSGGAYMGGRFTSSERDLAGRLQHWQAALALLQTETDWLFGKGVGRFPASFFFGAPGNEYPGSYSMQQNDDNRFLVLSGPRYQAGYGEVLRMGQRVAPRPTGRHRLEFDFRTKGKVKVSVGLCSKHLLYSESCGGREVALASLDPVWQHQALEFDVPRLGGSWYAPQLTNFSMAIETLGGRVDLDNLKLTDPSGRQMLSNGDFSDDMARWFFTSDHSHMPWHMKNLFLHVLFEQGASGLLGFVTLVAAAAMRTVAGYRSHHPYGPAIAAGSAGFLVVGLFDSLLDVPRVAFLFFIVILLAIQGRKAG